MSDLDHGSTLDIGSLLDEIRAKSKRRESENFKQSSYAGLRHRTSPRKYRDCEYVRQGRNAVRKLTLVEIARLQAHVDRVRRERE